MSRRAGSRLRADYQFLGAVGRWWRTRRSRRAGGELDVGQWMAAVERVLSTDD